jgi:hypothetical protein
LLTLVPALFAETGGKFDSKYHSLNEIQNPHPLAKNARRACPERTPSRARGESKGWDNPVLYSGRKVGPAPSRSIGPSNEHIESAEDDNSRCIGDRSGSAGGARWILTVREKGQTAAALINATEVMIIRT